MTLTTRSTFLLIFFGCTALNLMALYFQFVQEMHPCPLCITQRLFVFGVGLTALIAAIHNPRALWRRLYGLIGIGFALIGGGVSLRHVWIQNLPPDQVPSCGPGLGYMFENFPLAEAFTLLFQGDGNCADVSWTLLGLSMPAWVAIAFAGMIAVNLWQIGRR